MSNEVLAWRPKWEARIAGFPDDSGDQMSTSVLTRDLQAETAVNHRQGDGDLALITALPWTSRSTPSGRPVCEVSSDAPLPPKFAVDCTSLVCTKCAHSCIEFGQVRTTSDADD